MKELSDLFFDYITLTDTGRPGLTLYALYAQRDNQPLSLSELLHLQQMLFNAWMDKVKVMPDKMVESILRALPDRFWNVEFARRARFFRESGVDLIES